MQTRHSAHWKHSALFVLGKTKSGCPGVPFHLGPDSHPGGNEMRLGEVEQECSRQGPFEVHIADDTEFGSDSHQHTMLP